MPLNIKIIYSDVCPVFLFMILFIAHISRMEKAIRITSKYIFFLDIM